jgi:5-methylcytosine-specific restriction protein B
VSCCSCWRVATNPRGRCNGNGRTAIAGFLDAVNQELLPLVGEHLLIGPSHFMKADLSVNALRRIWTYNVFPLIEEQFWGDQDRIEHWRWEQVSGLINEYHLVA